MGGIPRHWSVHLLTTRFSPRAEETKKHLRSKDIEFETFLGLNHEISGVDRTAHAYDMDDHLTNRQLLPKTINIHLSHYMLWAGLSLLSDSDDSCHLVLEEDVRFEHDWSDRLEKALTRLPARWDLFYMGSCNCAGLVTEADHRGDGLYRVPRASCNHAYVVRGSALPVLLERCERVWAPIDLSMHEDRTRFGTRMLKSFAVLPRLATQDNTRILT
jgi:GR25 family glycosyltransferase involved in LPS biosynthesis